MTGNVIMELVQLGESDTLEFKTSTTQLKSACETLCAFLNANGGTVLIGVKDDGRIVGQHVTNATKQEISNYLAKFEPAISVEVNYIKIEESRYAIKLIANPIKTSKPYTFDGRPFWRVESSTRLMPQQRYHKLLIERTIKVDGWELEPAKHYTIEDLDTKEILNTISKSIACGRMDARLATKDPIQALRRLQLLREDKIINAAIVLFCQNPLLYYPQCLLRLFKFKSSHKQYLLDSKRIYGHAFTLLAEAEQFLMRHMSIRSEFPSGKMLRKDIPEYSLRAIREAVVNAICHRDYGMQGGSISLMIYDDRLEVSSHGELPFDITIDALKEEHESFPRNERITNVMYRCGAIESAGTGTQEMIRECQLIEAPEPEYIERGSIFVVRFPSSVPLTKAITPPQNVTLTPRQERILMVMRALEGESTTAQILAKIGDTLTDRTLRNDLAALEKLGRVKRQGQFKGTVWMLNKGEF